MIKNSENFIKLLKIFEEYKISPSIIKKIYKNPVITNVTGKIINIHSDIYYFEDHGVYVLINIKENSYDQFVIEKETFTEVFPKSITRIQYVAVKNN